MGDKRYLGTIRGIIIMGLSVSQLVQLGSDDEVIDRLPCSTFRATPNPHRLSPRLDRSLRELV